jgi:hypothetical protein
LTLLAQGPQPLQDLFDVLIDVDARHSARSDSPNQRDSQRVKRVGAGIS